jgi:hypothetical protein
MASANNTWLEQANTVAPVYPIGLLFYKTGLVVIYQAF